MSTEQESDYKGQQIELALNRLMEFFNAVVIIAIDSEDGQSCVRFNKDGNSFAAESALRIVSEQLTEELKRSTEDL